MLLALLLAILQMPIQPGRHTAPPPGFIVSTAGSINCPAAQNCAVTGSNIVSPAGMSIPVGGTLRILAGTDGSINVGGTNGSVHGELDVSCDNGSSWMTISQATGNVGQLVPAVPVQGITCTAPSNSNQILFRSTLNGGTSPGQTVTATWTAPNNTSVSW